ncbi:uncharacterized protein VICG_00107 [Vittaforma corneae ATCC 50505]|uniref:FH2 domain-containing protein n=1 Tax=Vittaforma corneae (strain ATCC 50505) TaxID=993615 RepID=L2GR46_VITCO|nr:uncharacterized protein VICG_00107 [Vittaforma corneae ATCC 50505]ELA42792.1 hypothetical protein VICG_00107 [Vittaforma corneae ATCC 50505]
MANNRDEEKLAIKKNLNVEKGIYQKIQMLSGRQVDVDENKSALKTNDLQASEVMSKAKTLDDKALKDPLIWKINDCLCVACEATTSRTDFVAKRNNIDILIEHLDKQYKDRYLALSFRRSSISKSYKKCLVFDDIEFNLEDACEISKIAKFWLDCEGECVLFVEMRNGKESNVLFILSCILSYCKIFWSAESALNSLTMTNPLKFQFKNLETVIRYVRYYDQIITFNTTLRFPQKILNQVIITTIPTILKGGSFVPKLKIRCKSGNTVFPSNKCYFDTNYIVFSHLNMEIAKDAVLSLYFVQEKESYHILDLSLNSCFYQQGLYRFMRTDIETSLPQENIYKFFDENFYIDLVIIENNESQSANPYTMTYDIAEVAKSVSERFFGEADDEVYKKLVNLGYSQCLSKVCSQLGLNEEMCKSLHEQCLEKIHHRQYISRNDEDDNRSETTIDGKMKSASRTMETPEINHRQIYQALGELEITEVPLIEHSIIHKLPNRRTCSRLFAKKQSPNVLVNETVFSIRPIHVNPLHSVENTIFSEIQGFSIHLDFQKFEKLFCEESQKKLLEKKDSQNRKDVIESKRLFIISLCLKQLEMKKVSVDELLDVLERSSENLTQQDFINILKILPTDDEKVVLESVAKEQLSHTEAAMLRLSGIPEIRQVVLIFVFETWFFEETTRIDQTLRNYNDLITLLLTSNELKILFKMLLEVTNLINYVYGRKRKMVLGFRIESLYLFSTYFGNQNYPLFDFIVEMLMKNNVKFEELRKAMSGIDQIKNEEIPCIKDRINKAIASYTECVQCLSEIKQFDTATFKKLLGYACKKLKETTAEYRKLEENVDLLKKKVGEESTKPINSVLETIHSFGTKLLESADRKIAKS